MYSAQAIEQILRQVSNHKISPQKAFQKLKHLSYEMLPFANIDHHRQLRKNLPEAIYAPGKTLGQLEKIIRSLIRKNHPVLATRLNEKQFQKLRKRFPKLSYSAQAQIAYLRNGVIARPQKSVTIITAGTSDIPIAEEARITLEAMGRVVRTFYDLGVAGIHRLLDHIKEIEAADAVICIAGMEGALPSVLAGLISKPIIAVPTSVGYGAGFHGITPLLTMLSSCAQGVAVVNIDSGFNAACFAHLMLR